MGRKILALVVAVGVLVSIGCGQTGIVDWSWKSTIGKSLNRVFQAEDGSTYVYSSGDFARKEVGDLTRFDIDGKMLWMTNVDSYPRIMGGIVFTNETTLKKTTIIDNRSGKTILTMQGQTLKMRLDNNIMVYCKDKKQLTKLDETGKILWVSKIDFFDSARMQLSNGNLVINTIDDLTYDYEGNDFDPKIIELSPSDNGEMTYTWGLNQDISIGLFAPDEEKQGVIRTETTIDYSTGKTVETWTFDDEKTMYKVLYLDGSKYIINRYNGVSLTDLRSKNDIWFHKFDFCSIEQFDRINKRILIVNDETDGYRHNYCLSLMDANNGAILWTNKNANNDGQSYTVIGDKLVFSVKTKQNTELNGLSCLDYNSGKTIWERRGSFLSVDGHSLGDIVFKFKEKPLLVLYSGYEGTKQRVDFVGVDDGEVVSSVWIPFESIAAFETDGFKATFICPDILLQFDIEKGVQIFDFIDDKSMVGEDLRITKDIRCKFGNPSRYSQNHAFPIINSDFVCFSGSKGTYVYKLHSHELVYSAKNKMFTDMSSLGNAVCLWNDKELVSVKIP